MLFRRRRRHAVPLSRAACVWAVKPREAKNILHRQRRHGCRAAGWRQHRCCGGSCGRQALRGSGRAARRRLGSGVTAVRRVLAVRNAPPLLRGGSAFSSPSTSPRGSAARRRLAPAALRAQVARAVEENLRLYRWDSGRRGRGCWAGGAREGMAPRMAAFLEKSSYEQHSDRMRSAAAAGGTFFTTAELTARTFTFFGVACKYGEHLRAA